MTYPVLQSIRVTFGPEGIEYAVTYTHSHEQRTPGSKRIIVDRKERVA